MKKILLSFLLIFCSFFANAQFYGGFCFDCESSIEAGVVYSNISGLEGASPKAGFYIGFYQFAYLSDDFALRAGTSYSNIGAEVDGYENPLVIHSIGFPLSLHYQYKYSFQVFAGGELGTNFFGQLPAYESEDTFDNSFEFSDQFTSFDASIIIGAGKIFFDTIDVNIRYNLGVTNINKDINGPKLKKNWLTLSVGYTFR
ncbi:MULTISPECIES: porin family protein [Mesonia]|uniref:Uncharacterized protein n=1 Tax=Mesonia oceanica TaxID=2687242 RepID=A0AC61Y389_9FLAO|nr:MULTISPECIES: porin family protein [Mesonia]MAN28672.1 hypothetical protein [Mesonia sp.]MAQ41353.1 hypothetical protein [Mesonia sp.]MBJ97452.1 hypothetical protein [Flavobacteriaceae bacterium]VVU98926.1 hypothetical protein FVB9532_00175 [Mesonia oceanica]|tara:strand:+ start:7263 stop:7862 length:600 start_codon:yes stop_codon:yes gene_type:complete